MSKKIDEQELRDLFAQIEAPAGLDRWRDRIADVHVEHLESPGEDRDAVVTELRPRTRKRRSFAVAAAVVAVVGLGGTVVISRLLGDTPPADPTMIIDGPDRTTSSPPPPSSNQSAPGSVTTPPPGTGKPTSGDPNAPGGPADGEPGGDAGEPGDDGPEPAWGPMTGDPTAGNTGVPVGATLSEAGNLRITTPGLVISDLRVTGTVVVDAPGVTLRRVVVVAPYRVPAVQQLAPNLTIVDSELAGDVSVTQRASGLVLRRSRIESGVALMSGAELYDNYLAGADVSIPAGTTGVLLRHNVMGLVSMSDQDGPISGVTIQDSVLSRVDAPIELGSASIHVLNNRFSSSSPSTGWNAAGTDYQWSGNTFLDGGAPANP